LAVPVLATIVAFLSSYLHRHELSVESSILPDPDFVPRRRREDQVLDLESGIVTEEDSTTDPTA
jgi:hypothetical protein